MGKFTHLATQPARGVGDILRWRVGGSMKGNRPPTDNSKGPTTRAFDKDIVASRDASLVWIGHASFLLTLGGKRILIDPVLGQRVGLIERISAPGIPLDEMPPIDIVLVTHNHRDHLDPWSIRKLGNGPTYVVPQGNRKLISSMAKSAKIIELDWWETTTIDTVEVMLVPARHWSMHWPWDRNEGLWGGYVIRGPEGTAYHSGDTAFWDTFAEIGKRSGGIDWAMLPIGAYEPRWFMEPQHMNPDEAAAAAKLLGAKNFVAMHWGTFKLTDEPIGEPPERARIAWAREGGKEENLWILDPGETRRLR
jgi:L-ascorbate metabolism protein UlaG (beta-lactamase superfamily)